MNVIRRCLENARVLGGDERPFSTHRFLTDGKSIFLESVREALATYPGEDVSALVDLKTNQLVFKQVVERTFKDLDIEDGSVAQLAPLRRKALDRHRSRAILRQAARGGFRRADLGLAEAAAAEGSAKRAARLFEVPLSVVNDAVAFEQSLMAA